MMGVGIGNDISCLGQGALQFISRASTATYIDHNGVLQTAGVNVPRYQNGALLVEGEATNQLPYSEDLTKYSSFQGTLATGSLTVASGSFATVIFGQFTQAGAFSISAMWDKSYAGQVRYYCGLQSHSVTLNGDGTFTETPDANWEVSIIPLAAGKVRLGMRCSVPDGSDGYTQIYIYGPVGTTANISRCQLETGGLSSYIPATNAPATRAADVVAFV